VPCRFALFLLLSAVAHGQMTATKDPTAMAIVQQSVTAMGGSVPLDSTASGTVTTTAGSLTENGTVVILTRGNNQSSEQIGTPSGVATIYSQGNASQVQGTTVTPVSLELAVTAQCSYFPLQLLANAINDPDWAFAYVGLESLNGATAHHIQFWDTFASVPQFAALATFSQRDIWIDAGSNLPLQVSYSDHTAQGAAAATAIDIMLGNFVNFGGTFYPTTIQKSVNGTPWATITITNVVFNTGLTDANFPVN
jgi:hypothetical protein